MFGFINERGDRLIAIVIFALSASLPILVDENGNILATDQDAPILVES